MPYLKIQTTEELLHANQLISKASRLVSEILGKPERYVMVALEETTQMIFGGNTSPAIFCELKSIGLPGDKTREISKKLCDFLSQETGVPVDRIYIEFANAERHMWGWNGTTFEK
jgi:phenylpyruvate tautomerase PptA (4-oxalocrotonate tautomerase family)